MGDRELRTRRAGGNRALRGSQLPSFHRLAVQFAHVISRLRGKQRRKQGDGTGALWPARVHRQAAPFNHRLPRRPVPAGSGVFRSLRIGPMYSAALSGLLGKPPRAPGEPIESFHQDLARSLQVVLEEILLGKVRYLHEMTGSPNLSYAGGVALNCVANSRIRRDGPFKDIFVQPAAGDAGGAVGAAALVHHRLTGSFVRHRLDDVRLGPAYDVTQFKRCLSEAGAAYSDFSGREHELLAATAGLLASGKVVGWFQGRMEFGPRALGSRSILADPRNSSMREHINSLVKKREAFRPFAPAVVAERC